MGDITLAVDMGPDFEREWPGADRHATECVLNVSYLYMQLSAFGQALISRHGVPSIAAFNVLTILHGAGEPLPPSVIAERMVVSRPTMTGIVRSLSQRGFIRSMPHPTDGRMMLIEITDAGTARVEQLRPELHQAEKRWISCLSTDEKETLLHLLARLQANAQTA